MYRATTSLLIASAQARSRAILLAAPKLPSRGHTTNLLCARKRAPLSRKRLHGVGSARARAAFASCGGWAFRHSVRPSLWEASAFQTSPAGPHRGPYGEHLEGPFRGPDQVLPEATRS